VRFEFRRARDLAHQIAPVESLPRARLFDESRGVIVQRRNDALHHAAFAQVTRERARIHATQRDDVVLAQPIGQRLLRAPVRWHTHDLARENRGALRSRRFIVRVVHTDVADVRAGERDHLPAIRRVGDDFLIAVERGVENDFANLAYCADRFTTKNFAVFQSQKRHFKILDFRFTISDLLRAI